MDIPQVYTMELLLCIITLVASFLASEASVLPREDTSCAQPKFNDAVTGNLSHLFGWQIAGMMAPFPDQLTAACNDISSLGRGKWGEIGLNPNDIQGPVCTTVNNNPGTNPKTEIANIIEFWTQLFITQLIGSFDEEARQYMCKNLDFFLIDYFMLTSADVVGAVCNSVGQQLPPRPFAPAHQVTGVQAAATAVKHSASNLYAILLAAGAATSAELATLCEIAPQFNASEKAEFLDASIIQSTLCSTEDPISVDDAIEQIYSGLTRIFIATVENISDTPGWPSWVCSNGGIEAMNCANLNGTAANQQICADASSG